MVKLQSPGFQSNTNLDVAVKVFCEYDDMIKVYNQFTWSKKDYPR